ncbi:hypothetical protein EGI26_06465 [Lacihabitans sp. CCS-44]|uniref:hypothetical protein n=1 Tax=Lacihabitans sp. CCS-44 TaxID=2487331 RepID=UPI0020CC690B|nr:hypothetical protein [Lacihabitans sp. CCS-44]MCP9754803.1 hypothetical protein [Lacihabitans sp. CCS-44]
MITVPKYKVIFGFIISAFAITLLIFGTYIFIEYKIYELYENVSYVFGLVFYTFISTLFAYQGFLYFHKPTRLDISNRYFNLSFPLSSRTLDLNEIKGYSQTNFRARGRNYHILLLYCSGQVYEFWSDWYDINELKELLKFQNVQFFGDESYKFKVIGLFLRNYKFL